MENKSGKMWFCFVMIGVFMCIMLMGMIIPKQTAASDGSNVNKHLYIKTLNQGLPFLKCSNKNEMRYSDMNLKSTILNIVGLDIGNPFRVIGKEMSYLNSVQKVEISYNEEVQQLDQVNKDKKDSIVDGIEVKPFEVSEEDKSGKEKEESNNDMEENKVVSVYNPDLVKEKTNGQPQVLIYHSHTSEGYRPGPAQTKDQNFSVVGVADEITKELENYGINVIHDKTYNDADYNNSYLRSGEILDNYLAKYGEMDLIIDLHRDGGPSKSSVTSTINGKNVARFMFVYAANNPHIQKNMKVINNILNIANELFPGLAKGDGTFDYKYSTHFFNQHKSGNVVLIEVGADVSEIDEAKECAKYLGRVIAEYLDRSEKGELE